MAALCQQSQYLQAGAAFIALAQYPSFAVGTIGRRLWRLGPRWGGCSHNETGHKARPPSRPFNRLRVIHSLTLPQAKAPHDLGPGIRRDERMG
jgi:hypothetical protein